MWQVCNQLSANKQYNCHAPLLHEAIWSLAHPHARYAIRSNSFCVQFHIYCWYDLTVHQLYFCNNCDWFRGLICIPFVLKKVTSSLRPIDYEGGSILALTFTAHCLLRPIFQIMNHNKWPVPGVFRFPEASFIIATNGYDLKPMVCCFLLIWSLSMCKLCDWYLW